MPQSSLFGHPGLAKLVERQMRNWELASAQKMSTPPAHAREVEDFVTISREVASGGAEIARHLGERLRWPVIDKQILQVMAGDDSIRRQLYESMDERSLGWFDETLRSLMEGKYAKNDYFRRLTEAILSIARQGQAIFLGRGADLILPQDAGLRVRIVSPLERCLQNYCERYGVGMQEARTQIERIEKERHEFLTRYFRGDALRQTRHDVIINLGRWKPEAATQLIIDAMRLRGMCGDA